MTALKNLTGQRVGQVLVLSYAGNGKWLCQCDCGAAKALCVGGLRTGKTQSCGCARLQKLLDRNRQGRVKVEHEDLSSRKFGRLTVMGLGGRSHYWMCRCDCGTEKQVQAHNLLRGMTRSCGCLLRDQNARFRRFESRRARDQATSDRKRARRHQDPQYAASIRAIARASARKIYGTLEGRVRAANKCAKRRALSATPISATEWLRLLEAWDCRCAYCGQVGTLTQDHVVALHNGGAHSLDNVVPACLSCNARKSDFALEQALQRLNCTNFFERRQRATVLLKEMTNA